MVASSFDMKLWRGHVIKITFGAGTSSLREEKKKNASCQEADLSRQPDAATGSARQHCVILKVRGSLDYPFDLPQFRDSLNALTSPESTTPKGDVWLAYLTDDVIIIISLSVMFVLTLLLIIICCRRKSVATENDVENVNPVVDDGGRQGDALLTGFVYDGSQSNETGSDVTSTTTTSDVSKRGSSSTVEYMQVCDKSSMTSPRTLLTSSGPTPTSRGPKTRSLGPRMTSSSSRMTSSGDNLTSSLMKKDGVISNSGRGLCIEKRGRSAHGLATVVCLDRWNGDIDILL